MHLQHRQQKHGEERAVVQREKTCAFWAYKSFVLRQENRRREAEPVAH
jgi:hypothetical protein